MMKCKLIQKMYILICLHYAMVFYVRDGEMNIGRKKTFNKTKAKMLSTINDGMQINAKNVT